MSNIAIKGAATGTGVFTLESPATNTNRTLTLPDEAGTILTTATAGVPIGGPAFRAYMSAAQTISGSTFTKLNFNTEVFDINSNYDTATYRFTPTVAGYYQITASVYFAGTYQLYIYKNGIVDASGQYLNATGHSASSLVYLNGSLDYVEAYFYGNAVTTANNSTNANQFTGVLVRSAT